MRQKIEPVATDFPAIIQLLGGAGVDFILVGGLAAIGHGLALITYDVDVVYSRRAENVDRLVAALEPIDPYLRALHQVCRFNLTRKPCRWGSISLFARG